MAQLEIHNVLANIKLVLERCGERQWSQEFAYLLESFDQAYAAGSDNRKREALDRILRIYGGMGSFSDLRFSMAASHKVSFQEQSDANRELHDLSTRLFSLADAERKRLSPPK